MAPDDQRHGTNAGYQAHRRAGQPTCTPCRKARREYYRARNRALERLAVMHPGLFRALVAEEAASVGAESEALAGSVG